MTEATLFAIALEKSSPAERASFLDAACAGDGVLRRRIEVLLASHSQAGSFLQPPRIGIVETIDEPGCERPGTQIGQYKLLEQIGEGGFGFVYMAEQTHPVRRKVALKILKPGMDTRQVVARFEAERQALALMDHPNIAHILDGGETASGRPYFVMELVRGIPITDYCDQHHLSIRQRLELFVNVCQAVQHAHQKGIIHRDLKPSNVMVTLHDDKPVVKVIDFGIAKATGQQLTNKTLFTNFAQLIGTPLYMSPEQAQLSGLDIDTRSDVYSLGVLLYELLTGTTPFDGQRLRTVGLDEVRRIIREEEPARPSTRMSTLGDAAASVSANRGSDPRRLKETMRGELDWIVMTALEKDRNRRYEAASAFSADVQRYLQDEPVQACPPSAGYRLRKFVRRNRVALLTVGMVMLAMLVGTAISTWQAVRARIAEREAEANFEDARSAVDQMLLRVSDDRLRSVPQSYPVRKALLEDALTFYEGFMRKRPHDPDIRLKNIQILQSLGQLQERMSQLQEADQSLRRAVAIAGTLVADDPTAPQHREALARSQETLAASLAQGAQLQESQAGFRRAMTLWTGLLSDFPTNQEYEVRLGSCRTKLAEVLLRGGRPEGLDEAETLLEQAVASSRALFARSPDQFSPRKRLVVDSQALASVFQRRGKPEKAEEILRQTLDEAEKLVTHSGDKEEARRLYAKCLLQRGRNLSTLGRKPEAFALSLKALEIREQLVQDFPEIRDYQVWLAEILLREVGPTLRQTDPKQSETAFRRALAIYEELGKREPGRRVRWLTTQVQCRTPLAGLLFASNRRDEAELLWRQAWMDAETVTRSESGKRHLVYELLKVWPEAPAADAERVYHKALPLLDWFVEQDPSVSDHRQKALLYRRKLIVLLYHSRRSEEAQRQWLRAFALFDKVAAKFPNQPHYGGDILRSQLDAASQLRMDNRTAEAETLTRLVIKTCEKLAADFPQRIDCRPELVSAYTGLGALLSASGHREGEQVLRQALALGEKLTTEFPDKAEHWTALGVVHCELAQWNEAVTCLTRATKVNSDAWVALLYRGYAHSQLKQWEQAVADQSKAIAINPNVSWCWYRRGQAYTALHQWDKALPDFARAVELGNNHPWIRVAKAAAHAQLNQPEQCLIELRQAFAHGFRDANHLKFGTDFESVRGREDFKTFLAELESK